ncbi:cingulin-like protein 1 [Polymixia lowei]
MESYRLSGIPTSGLQQGYTQPSRPSRAHNNGAGTYGLSIRVQGIDGHPYVVLNNQDRGPQAYVDPNSNGYVDTESSFIDNYDEYDFRGGKESGSNSPFMEYRSQKLIQHTGPQNGVADSQGKKPSGLLNFQKHPELLQPYDPESNSLNLDRFRSLPPRPLSLAETEINHKSSSPKSALPVASHARSSSLDQSKVPAQQEKTQLPSQSQTKPASSKPQSKQAQPQSLPQAQLAQPHNRPQTQVAQPQFKPQSSSQSKPLSKPQAQRQPTQPSQPQASAVSGPISEQNKTSCTSPSTISSANSSLERTRREPDILPLRRTDSSGPVLQSSSRSRHSSSSSTNTTKALLDDQLENLYADTINRHQNRRYIPFLPGTGRDIDTGSIPGVDELIEKFDGKEGSHQRRGRAGRRNRINAEDRKRSRSVDSALPFGLREGSNYMDEFSKRQGTSMEHVLRPSQLRLQKTAGSQDSWVSAVDGKTSSRASSRGTSAPGSPQSTVSTGVGSIQGYKKPQSRSSTLPLKGKEGEEGASSSGKVAMALSKPSSTTGKKPGKEADVQATPDLLKGQQELSQQTHEETAKQILFNYLKDGNNDNDDTTKRKVNLVFEKIQTLKSRATGSVQGDNRSLDLAAQTKALQEQKAELEKELANLKGQLEEQSKKSQSDSTEKTLSSLKDLQQELQQTTEGSSRLKEKLVKTEAELQTTLEELFQVKMEREQYQTEIRDLQDQLSEMHDELDTAKTSAADGEKDTIMADLMQLKVELQEVLLAKEELEEVLRRRERELTALKGALKEEVATHDQEVDKLREQYEKEISRLQTCLEDAKQNSAAAVREKADVEAAKGAAEGQAGRLTQEAERLRRRAQELENEVAKLNRIIDEAKLQESRLGDRVGKLEKEKKQLEESLAEIKEQEEEMSRANRALTTRLEDVQRNLTKLNSEHRELEERLKDERIQKEQFKNTKNEIEDERRLLDRTVEKLQREMNDIVEASQSSTQELQEQIDIYKEKNRRELAELQRQLKERGQELEKSRLAAKALQEELSRRDDDLRQCKRERDEAVLTEKTLEQKIFDLEVEAETHAHTKDDKSRHIKIMEDRITQLELDLDEERQSGDQLMDRIDRGREQVEQMRNELLQERASRQDLECDKMALERQNKDLKGRVTHLEGSQKSNKEGLVTQLETRIQELEERLEGEERERANLQLVNRRLERKVKEMMMQVDEEHHSMQDQKDQLNLRLKALKRQMDEAEEEIDRLEHGKKKLQRDLDEQQEANEQLQSQLKALRSEIRRKSNSAPLLNNLDDDDDDDDISTDGETYFSSSSGYKRSSSQDNLISTFTL